MTTDPAAETVSAVPAPARTGPAKYLLPRTWPARVVLAWSTGFVLMVAAHAIDRGDERHYTAVAFWTLIIILAAFIVSDGLRAWRRRHSR